MVCNGFIKWEKGWNESGMSDEIRDTHTHKHTNHQRFVIWIKKKNS